MRKKLLILTLSTTLLFGIEDVLDNLLGEFAQNSDLSRDTKIKNQGHSIIYTRADLDRMQARNLRDIVKSIPFFTLLESDINFPNLNMMSDKVPFSSSQIRIYLDNHEITSGIYGSIFGYMGSIELEFVDHIELYLAMPSFEYSSESTQVLIKLHTKVPKRDDGGKVLLSQGSYGGNQQSAYYSKGFDKFSYFAYLSRLEDKRDNPRSFDQEVSKDKSTNHFVGTLFNDKHHLLVNAMDIKQYLYSGISLDGTTTKNETQYSHLQTSYQNKSHDKFIAKISYQYTDDEITANDEQDFYRDFVSQPGQVIKTNSVHFHTIDKVATIQLDYLDKFKNHNILLGTSFRNKLADIKAYETNNGPVPDNGYHGQDVFSGYVQDEININNNSIFAISGKYSKINNDKPVSNQILKTYRIGYTYNQEDLITKFFYYDNPTPIEPYLYSSYFAVNQNIVAEESKNYVTEIEYKNNGHIYRILLSKGTIDNALFYNEKFITVPISPSDTIYIKSVDNYQQTIETKKAMLDYCYDFSPLNSLRTNYFIQSFDNSTNGDYIEKGGYLRFLNTIDKFDIFNEVVYRETSLDGVSAFDYSAGIKYRQNKNLSFSIKGENILDRAIKQKTQRRTTSDYINFQELSPMITTPIDKRYYGTMEYSF